MNGIIMLSGMREISTLSGLNCYLRAEQLMISFLLRQSFSECWRPETASVSCTDPLLLDLHSFDSLGDNSDADCSFLVRES